jgi:hypothetical protein
MNGLMFFDGDRHIFLPADRQGAAVWTLSTPLLERIARVGQEPLHHGTERGMPQPDCNNAPSMRLVAAELARRAQNAVTCDRAADAAVQAHARRRWLGHPLTNYGRTA